ncbi:YL1 nuclear protein-domain-containing protein [Crassisporium funariophilum]|nr:YL1 nuclear protein-domain-containing protein [Crassisporium funariophilum]
MEEPAEMLVTRRPRRTTAGNRMEAALAEMALDDAARDPEDDNDFVNDKDEEDVFGSDFESTDEEAEKQVAEAGENEIVYEERRLRKAGRSQLEKTTAAAHAKHKATFMDPDLQPSASASKPKPKAKTKTNQRVAMGDVVDAETGESVAPTKRISGSKRMRSSQRKHTVQNTSATVTRLKQSQQKKASQPKKAKIEYKRHTQGELIALALDTEEGNIVEHRDYLKNEAEKRKRARVVRTTVEGPLLRWISKKEEVKVLVPLPPPPPAPSFGGFSTTSSTYRGAYGTNGNLFTPMTYSYTAGTPSFTASVASVSSTLTAITQTPPVVTQSATHQTATTQIQSYQRYLDPVVAAFPTWPPPSPAPDQQPHYASAQIPVTAPATASTSIISMATTQPVSTNPSSSLPATSQSRFTSSADPLPQPPPQPEPEYRIETVTKNYVIHELTQHKDKDKAVLKPTWAESMEAMFGDHVKWDEIKVFVGKGRPLSRPRQTCPITGRQAHYLDPRTGVPYADSLAYKVLSGLLRHEYVWSPMLGCYIGREEPQQGIVTEGEGDEGRGGAMSVVEDS